MAGYGGGVGGGWGGADAVDGGIGCERGCVAAEDGGADHDATEIVDGAIPVKIGGEAGGGEAVVATLRAG